MDKDKEKKIIELLDQRSEGKLSEEEFKALDSSDKEMIESIDKMDHWMKMDNVRQTSVDFTENVMTRLSSSSIRRSGGRLLGLLLGICGFILVACLAVAILVPGNSENPAQIDGYLVQFNQMLSIVANPKFQQFLIVSEGIILLVIMEKILSSQRFFHKLF